VEVPSFVLIAKRQYVRGVKGKRKGAGSKVKVPIAFERLDHGRAGSVSGKDALPAGNHFNEQWRKLTRYFISFLFLLFILTV
jgi:hypothetical protein